MFVMGTIVMLALIALTRAILVHKYASQIQGKDIKEEFWNTLALARNRPVVGGLLIGLWAAQYLLLLALLVVLVRG